MTGTESYDVIIIGGGGAGLMAALKASEHARTAVISKLHPMRSHTGAAQGGIGAALGNLEEDHPEWHALDTIKCGDYLGDQDAVHLMCNEAPGVIYELEHLGLAFSRTSTGTIAQRPLGGHTNHLTGRPITRSCYATDRVGQMLMQTLYQRCVQQRVAFYNEYLALDLLMADGAAAGVAALELPTGKLHRFSARTVIFATGGYGRLWKITSNSYASTGDGLAIALRRGLPAQDLEFFQFHPTGLAQKGILLTESLLSSGGTLLNRLGERFMEAYAPRTRELVSRDVISRAMVLEARKGNDLEMRGCFHLDMRPEMINKYADADGRLRLDGSPYRVTKEEIQANFPDLIDLCHNLLGINPLETPIPVQPTAHYAMGGIPTDLYGRVLIDGQQTVSPGVYAVGECACISVHGANRLGGNSLLELLVFGKQAGLHAAEYAAGIAQPTLSDDSLEFTHQQLFALANGDGSELSPVIRDELRQVMAEKVGVFRSAEGLASALETVQTLRSRFKQVHVNDHSNVFNIEMQSTWELGNLLDVALLTIHMALARTESRGAHAREDYPQRNDETWLKHSLAWLENDQVRLDTRNVTLIDSEPKERSY